MNDLCRKYLEETKRDIDSLRNAIGVDDDTLKIIETWKTKCNDSKMFRSGIETFLNVNDEDEIMYIDEYLKLKHVAYYISSCEHESICDMYKIRNDRNQCDESISLVLVIGDKFGYDVYEIEDNSMAESTDHYILTKVKERYS